MIKLYDRIKERSYTIGTGNFVLNGVFSGFSSFQSVYQDGDQFFYVANDGSHFEIGSGVYISTVNEIQRFPIKSSNSNQKVSFPEGLKEVYVNYPATNSVFNGSGIDVLPVNSGLAFWTSSNSLSSENYFYIDSGNHRLGILKSDPSVAIEIGGPSLFSNVKASGYTVGNSGIYFPPQNNGDSSYLGGRQLTHYEMNQLDQFAFDQELIGENTGLSAVVSLSGNVNQFFLLNKQNAGTFFAGPSSGCDPGCEPNYPVFRPIDVDDLPDLSSEYATVSYVNTLAFPAPTVSETNQYNGGRLSLSSSDSVNIDSVSSGNTLYYVPFSSNLISLWNGSSWELKQFNSSIVVESSDIYSGAMEVYDVFAFINQNNEVDFFISAWEGFDFRDSSNNNVLTRYDGILCRKNDKYKKYIGSFAIGNLDGTDGLFYDSNNKRLVFNAYNQVTKFTSSSSPVPTDWIYSSTTFAAIAEIEPVEILDGYCYESDNDFGISNPLNLSLSIIYVPVYPIKKGYILGISIDYPNNLSEDITYENIKNNKYILTNLDYLSMEYNDTVQKTLRSTLTNLNNSGWKKYYGIQKSINTSDATLRITNNVLDGGINGRICGNWRC